MRRTVCLLLEVSAGLVFAACGTDSATTVGVRSDGITVVCNQGESYYDCSPQTPPPAVNAPPGDGGGSGGSGSGGDGGGGSCTPWPTGPANVLWPPNHKLIMFSLDDCANLSVCPDGQVAAAAGSITKITVDEAIDVGAGGDGHTTNYDAKIVDATHFELRSERQGGADGRVYTVYFADAAGHAGSCQYLVPHNQGPFEGAVNSGTVVTITP